ncbi:MAG: Gfo/Idh/MocA family oxidoreductase [Clostridia bacterium]|nr:Gfo/Idh/MocA family oxidoreductase [Clostridia bacterium]
MKVRIGIVGLGSFSGSFVRLFKNHPDVEEMAICDLVPERVEAAAKNFGITRTYTSLEDMLENGKDLNCIGIFTQRHLHAPMVLKALDAGKHVYSAVPIACTIEEIGQIIEKVKSTRQIYMMGETCYYYPCAIYCRQQYEKGEFGKFVYAESQYYHDICEMYGAFKHSGGENWERDAGIPPMFYPTHSVSMVFSAIHEYATKVSCLGLYDDGRDNIYGVGKNHWDNPFSNETAIFRMSGGGVVRINEFRRAGINKPSSYITAFYGDMGAYECSVTQHTFQKGEAAGKENVSLEDVGPLVNTIRYNEELNSPEGLQARANAVRYIEGYAPIQDRSRLPKNYRDLKPGAHYNSHGFLVDDFVRAVVDEKLPPNNAWDSARYMIPGLIAHESALRDGELLDVPDFGDAPADWARLTYEKKDYYEDC